MNRKARSLGAALLAVALLVGALPTTGITAAAPSPAVGTTLLAGTTLVTGAGSGVFPSRAGWGGGALSGGWVREGGGGLRWRPPAGGFSADPPRGPRGRAPAAKPRGGPGGGRG